MPEHPGLRECADLFDTAEGRAKLRAGYATARVSITPNHATFLDAFRQSHKTVRLVARWLHGQHGFAVHLPPTTEAPTAGDWQDHVDTGDILASHPAHGGPHRVDVKRRRLAFTGREDFPFPTIFVCNVPAWERADPKPWRIYSVNQAGTVLACIKGTSRPHWQVELVPDLRYGPGHIEPTFTCALDHVQFIPLGAPYADHE